MSEEAKKLRKGGGKPLTSLARVTLRGLEQPRGAGLRRLANAIPGGPRASAAGAALAARRAIAAFQGMVRLGGGSNSP